MPQWMSVLLLIAGLGFGMAVQAQTTELALGGIRQDSAAPVGITADQLKIDQATGTAVFTGKVVIVQGSLKLSADAVRVEYLEGEAGATGQINRLLATGNVLMVTPTEAAEAAEAEYSVASSLIVMTGNVVLTQGASAVSGQKITINLADGTAVVEGRVTTTLQTGGKAP